MPIAGRINLCTQRYYFFRRRGLVFSVERLKFDRLLENEILILQIPFFAELYFENDQIFAFIGWYVSSFSV